MWGISRVLGLNITSRNGEIRTMTEEEKTAQALLAEFQALVDAGNAPGQNDLDSLGFFMADLFKKLDALAAIQFVVAQARNYLPIFEQLNPEIRWPRDVLDAVGNLEQIEVQDPQFKFFEESRVYDEHNTPIPGAAPFVDAVTMLRLVPQQYANRSAGSWVEMGVRNVCMAFTLIIWAHHWTEWANCCPQEVAIFWTGKRSIADGDKYEASSEDREQANQIFRNSKERKRIYQKLCLKAANDLKNLLEDIDNPV